MGSHPWRPFAYKTKVISHSSSHCLVKVFTCGLFLLIFYCARVSLRMWGSGAKLSFASVKNHWVTQYCGTWCLTPNKAETVSGVFHLNNARAGHKHPTLRSTAEALHQSNLPRSDPWQDSIFQGTPEKARQQKLSPGTTCSASSLVHKLNGRQEPPTLHTSALALTYSAAEYCVSVWTRSSYTHNVDTQLKTTIRIITGTLLTTPLLWQPVLSNITPQHISWVVLTQRMLQKVEDSLTYPRTVIFSTHPQLIYHQDDQFGWTTPPADFTTQSA